MSDGFPAKIRQLRLSHGLTLKAASASAGVHINSWVNWESGRVTPKLWRCGAIARALGVPVAALFTDELVVADVVVSAETVKAIRAGGREACQDVAKRLASQLEPVIWAAVTAPKVDTSPGRRAKRRRTRTEVLAGVKQANEMRRAKVTRQQPDAIQ